MEENDSFWYTLEILVLLFLNNWEIASGQECEMHGFLMGKKCPNKRGGIVTHFSPNMKSLIRNKVDYDHTSFNKN